MGFPRKLGDFEIILKNRSAGAMSQDKIGSRKKDTRAKTGKKYTA